MEPIDELIRAAAPRAPRDLYHGVAARLHARRRTRRALAGAGLFVAAAAALVLWLVARPPQQAAPSAWRVTAARAATVNERALAPGAALAVGALVHVADGGEARLERATATARPASVTLAANTDARVGDGAVELLTGSARLEGPEARLTGDVAEVTTLATGGAATVERRRTTMTNAQGAALAALMMVTAHDGGTRVEAKGQKPVLLAKDDRTLVAPKMPPLTTRAPARAPAATAKKPAPAAAAKPAGDDDKLHKQLAADVQGELDKESIRRTIRGTLGDIRGCYEQALASNPHIGGRFVVEFTIVTKDGKGRISDGEIQPNEGDLDEPALQQCILSALSRAEFPPSVDGEPVIVSYPFVLRAQ